MKKHVLLGAAALLSLCLASPVYAGGSGGGMGGHPMGGHPMGGHPMGGNHGHTLNGNMGSHGMTYGSSSSSSSANGYGGAGGNGYGGAGGSAKIGNVTGGTSNVKVNASPTVTVWAGAGSGSSSGSDAIAGAALGLALGVALNGNHDVMPACPPYSITMPNGQCVAAQPPMAYMPPPHHQHCGVHEHPTNHGCSLGSYGANDPTPKQSTPSKAPAGTQVGSAN